ncbi:hypothetical protein JOF56_007924 [Kibdelosporangium banguiense]|uniref:Uncharacterized protein n=1 Tax=Kibdelosporangium banguiense TaxID=1365924 RepID=A0ABS4TT18_9PSEU|nr:hypothetical protein [Kibdelosporangium banguiense]
MSLRCSRTLVPLVLKALDDARQLDELTDEAEDL